MIFTPIELNGAFIIRLDKIKDERGFFARAWCRNEFAAHGLMKKLVQANVAFSRQKGTLRGMHYQLHPYEEAKLVWCTRGIIYDVMIDLREDSPTFKRWYGRKLTQDNYEMLYVPEGFAHGYQTLTDHAELFDSVSEFYSPENERGIRWNDSRFDIDWPLKKNLVISEKDKSWPDFSP